MTMYIQKHAEHLSQPGRSGRGSLCLYSPVAGVGLVSPAFGIRGFAQLDSNETGMT
jgi:hypothetical protein